MVSPPLWLDALAFRLLNAFCSRAFFQPDEYWQNLEVAHRWIYGYGYQTWEWRTAKSAAAGAGGGWNGDRAKWGTGAAQWANVLQTGGGGGIRSPLSVAGTAAVYAVLKALRWDEGPLLILAPRLLQACIAASADMAVRRLATRVLGPPYANAALFASLTSFFNFHTSTRTLSNSTETALTAWALALWPRETRSGERIPRQTSAPGGSLAGALGLAALATIIRPSNAVIWFVLGSSLSFRAPRTECARILGTAVAIALSAALFSLALDTSFYGTPTFTPLRFLHTNVFQSISLFYGANAWHFYLSQGLPILLFTQVPFFLDGWYSLAMRRERCAAVQDSKAVSALGWTLGLTLAAYSLLSHKEWRFIHPILPIMHLFVACSLVNRWRPTKASIRISDEPCPPSSALASSLARLIPHTLRIRPSHALFLAFSLLPAVYLAAFHGLAQNTVMAHLRSAVRSDAGEGRTSEIGLLMPCHSTGWQAFLHRPEMEAPLSPQDRERMWMVTCEPPILGQDPTTYQDESDIFYSDPCSYIVSRLSPLPASSGTIAAPLTSRLVLFSSLLDQPCASPNSNFGAATVRELLMERMGYAQEWEGWNTLGGWHEDARRRGTVQVWRRDEDL
ncbi:hypothetical protein JCM10908_006180 [Rhodotorula pacifica]|uniref:putative glycosylphosphatidylinositol-alpha 1,2 mannosyltransferase n=1 Tax=Rhodotorula pacifica TaxID=1495444 RepID=UPI00316CEBFE